MHPLTCLYILSVHRSNVCVYMHICVCIYASTNMYAHPEIILFKYFYASLIRWESVLVFYHVVLRSLTFILKLHCKHLSPLNHLTSTLV